MAEEVKEPDIFEYLPKILPVLDVLCILWITYTSPAPWITCGIQISIPVFGLTTIHFFKDKGTWGFYIIGLSTCIPLFCLNLWASPDCPTWINEITFIFGGLLLSRNMQDRIIVFMLTGISTVIPMCIAHSTFTYIGTAAIAELCIWFLLERSVYFMKQQKIRVEAQKHTIEEKNKEIIDSINYARRIQKAHLPTEKYIDSSLKRLQKK